MPRAMPKSTRPLVNWSMRAMSSATRRGCQSGRTTPHCPNLSLSLSRESLVPMRMGLGAELYQPSQAKWCSAIQKVVKGGLVGEFDLGLGLVDYLFPGVGLAYVGVEGDVKAHLRSQGVGSVGGFAWLLYVGECSFGVGWRQRGCRRHRRGPLPAHTSTGSARAATRPPLDSRFLENDGGGRDDRASVEGL